MNQINEYVELQKKECESNFMSKTNFYRSLLAIFVGALSFATGGFAWAMSTSNQISTLNSDSRYQETRIKKLEDACTKQTVQYEEIIRILKEIKK